MPAVPVCRSLQTPVAKPTGWLMLTLIIRVHTRQIATAGSNSSVWLFNAAKPNLATQSAASKQNVTQALRAFRGVLQSQHCPCFWHMLDHSLMPIPASSNSYVWVTLIPKPLTVIYRFHPRSQPLTAIVKVIQAAPHSCCLPYALTNIVHGICLFVFFWRSYI